MNESQTRVHVHVDTHHQHACAQYAVLSVHIINT